jgi:hypothetical protein
LMVIESGSIGELILNAVSGSNFSAPVAPNGFSNIGLVAGAGVLASGWEFPDGVMADDVPYISSTSGMPSIKLNGVVEPYAS